MVYILIGDWPGETSLDREYRRQRLREFGARPYPMPFVGTKTHRIPALGDRRLRQNDPLDRRQAAG